MRPRLLAISGVLTGTISDVADGQISIGRDRANGLCLEATDVSRRHCRIQVTGERYELIDLESRNGTFVNGVPARTRFIVHGDTIRVGQSEFVFLSHEGESNGEPKRRLKDMPSSTRAGGMDGQRVEVTQARRDLDRDAPHFGAEVGRMARDLVALVKIANAINSIRESERLQVELLRLIFEVIPAESGAVLLLTDGDEEEASAICTWSREAGADQPMELQRDLVHRALWERCGVFAPAGPGRSEVGNVLCVPLVAVEKTIGVIYLASAVPAPPFREDHMHFLDSVSRIAAVTLENILALDALVSENRSLKEELRSTSKLVGESPAMKRVEEFIARVAHSDSNVLIRGESGTGKEVVARALHESSSRRDRPFVAVNCAAIPETLLESELFGHEKGAFTGAVAMRKGRLEAADDGTLFLDEIGELAPGMQAKLLRVLQQREFERLGGTRPIALKARVLAATNRNLEEAIKTSEFRQDLYYRLNVVSVTVPPLREHREDVPLLALYFAAKFAGKSRRPFKGISREARSLLMGHAWPGNVRELENAMEHAIVLGLTEEILPEDLPANMMEMHTASLGGSRYHDVLAEKKKELVVGALKEAGDNVPEAARRLGIHPKYLHRLVRQLGLRAGSETG